MAILAFLIMCADRLLHREWKWFSRIGIDAMWAGACMAGRK